MGLEKTFNHVAKLANPYLSKLLRFERELATDWKLEMDKAPPRRLLVNPSSEMGGVDANVVKKSAQLEKRNVDLRRPYRILCLDGGGIRGVLTTTILKRICEHNPKFLDNVDFICGTSAGGLLSLLLASGYTADECDAIYSFAAPHIFGHNPWRAINPFRAKYSDKAKQELMEYYYGGRNMGDLQKACAVIAFRLDGRKSHTHMLFNKEGWRPAVFSNIPRAASLVHPDVDLAVWDAAMRTSAAPTYFPVFRGYTDGGLIANNPSMVAVTKAMAHYPNVNPKNIAVLSIGAGNFPRHTEMLSKLSSRNENMAKFGAENPSDKNNMLWRADWGLKQWIPYLLDILMDGDSVTTEMVMHYLLAASGLYHRIDPRLPRQIALDDVTAIQELKDFGNSVDLTETFKFVDEKFTYEEDFDNDVHNSLDSAGNYHDAWHNTVPQNRKEDM
eukprot:gene18061-20572_t